MHRDDDDTWARRSFSFGGTKGSGGATSDTKTAAQLAKLQRLVQSLVVRELERGEHVADAPARQDAHTRHADHRQPPPQQRQPFTRIQDSSGGAAAAGTGSGRRPYGRYAPIDSDSASYDASLGNSGGGGSSAPDMLGHGRTYGSVSDLRGPAAGVGAAGPSGIRGGGSGRAGGSAGAGLEEGVQLQVAALQGQLAMLGEQLGAAYRAAEGAAPPPPQHHQQHHHQQHQQQQGAGGAAAGATLTALRSQTSMYGNGGSSSLDPGLSGGQVGGTARPVSPGLPGQRPYFLAAGMATSGPLPGSPLQRRTAASSGGDGAADGAGSISGGFGTLGSLRSRQTAEERASREASAREDERLRGWIQELRAERRRLEDRLLDGDTGGAAGVRQLRDDLEQQVLGLSRQRDQLAAEINELGTTRALNAQLAGQVEALETALAVEVERVARYKEVRPVLEGRLAEVSASLESLRRQHAAALDVLARERDAAVLKAKRGTKRTAELEAALEAANADVRRLQDEVRSQVVTLAEARASTEVLQSASQQMQANMEAQAKDTATRLAAVQAQLESSQSECTILRRQLDTAQQGSAALRDQLKEAHARLDAQASERDRLGSSLMEEQRAAAAARQHAESLATQLKASEEARADAARAAAAQLEAVRRQHAADMAATQKQYESQLAVAEKQYLLLQRQYDAGLASSDMAAEAAVSLRRERDALWAEAQNLKAELEEARKEKADVASKLATLRAEVRTTLEEVARERDSRLAAAASQNESLLREATTEAERRLAAVKQDYETKLASVMDVADKLRSEVVESQRQVDKYRATANHLKDQVRDLLLSRDAAERELSSERAFNEELNRILTTIRAEQQQQHQHQQYSSSGLGMGVGMRLASPAD